MIDKKELIERVEQSLTTRTAKEMFKGIVESCKDVQIPSKCEADDDDDWHKIDFKEGWNRCVDEMRNEMPVGDSVETNWKEEFENLVQNVGSATYGKSRWFPQDDVNSIWYDREYGDYISLNKLKQRIYEELAEE